MHRLSGAAQVTPVGDEPSGAAGHPPADDEPRATIDLRLIVNGNRHSVTVPANRLLIDVLRTDLGLTGTKEGCGVGVCGACSVIVDGRLLSSCILLAVSAQDAEVTTVEGLAAADGTLTPLQSAFIRYGGFQCGICTPGQLVAATALLDRNPTPTEPEVREWLTGNLCRCTGYAGIVEAVLRASEAPGPPNP
jgi:carbon-monoxide dehydrogenase small subunit